MFDQALETRPWDEQFILDDAHYRRQILYLLERSPFYRTKLGRAGFSDPDRIGGLDRIAALPFTEKSELRASCTPDNPVGAHLCVERKDMVRIYSTSGTTGTPSFIPLTKSDLENWVSTSARSYAASGVGPGETVVSTYNAGPFVAGAALAAFDRLGLTHIPVGTGNTDRLMTVVKLLKPTVAVMTPSYASYLIEWAAEREFDLRNSSVKRLLVAGEPGGGEPAMRARLEQGWGARVTEAMGIGDISVSLWGECQQQDGMHFSGRGLVHVELIEPETGRDLPLEDGAEGELVYTHLRQRAVPLLRFRSRDRVRVSAAPCACGRTAPRVRCIGRTDDMLILRGVNLFPSAVREVVGSFAAQVSGVISIRPAAKGVAQLPPLPILVELAPGADPPADLAERIQARIRETLVASVAVTLVPHGTLPRTDYKSKLVDWSEAQ